MKLRFLIRALFATAMLLGAAGSAQALIIGTADPNSGNCFPFTCAGSGDTRYQQVYASSSFAGVTSVTSVSFFNTEWSAATFSSATYTLTLSTSNFTVNNLDTSTLSNNPGGDAALFASVSLSGATGAQFDIVAGTGGGGSFLYDPSAGDLLVDIVLTGLTTGGSGFLDAMNGSSGGLFSRAHDFGTGFTNSGLVTGFNLTSAPPPPPGIPEPATLSLMGIGLIGACVARRRRKAV